MPRPPPRRPGAPISPALQGATGPGIAAETADANGTASIGAVVRPLASAKCHTTHAAWLPALCDPA